MALQAFIEGTETVVAPGETVNSSGGERGRFVMATRPRIGGKSGKIMVTSGDSDNGIEYYDRVFGLEVREA